MSTKEFHENAMRGAVHHFTVQATFVFFLMKDISVMKP